MKYLKYIFGIQLFLGAIWCFYYSALKIGFILLALASIILVPLIYGLLKKKISGFKAGCLIFSVFFIGLSWAGISYLCYLLAPVDTNIVAVKDNKISVYAFEQSLISATQTCFNSYDKAFSKDIKYQDEQCSLISDAKKSCNSAQQEVDEIIIQNSSNKELISLLNEAKSDAKSSLQAWESFFSFYNNQCISKNSAMNPTEVKLQLVSAAKNMYLMNMKIKKAKSIS